MAVAFILDLYLGVLVQALVNDLVMSIIMLATPGVVVCLKIGNMLLITLIQLSKSLTRL